MPDECFLNWACCPGFESHVASFTVSPRSNPSLEWNSGPAPEYSFLGSLYGLRECLSSSTEHLSNGRLASLLGQFGVTGKGPDT